jgi:hypothetical protein
MFDTLAKACPSDGQPFHNPGRVRVADHLRTGLACIHGHLSMPTCNVISWIRRAG